MIKESKLLIIKYCLTGVNPISTIVYHLYLFQLENYDLRRFWILLRKTGGRKKQPARKKLVWTVKATLLFGTAIFLIALAALVIASIFESALVKIFVFVFLFYLFACLAPVFLSLALLIIRPLDYIVKAVIVSRAKAKMSELKNLVIIGITGSYGKTTMKEALATILRSGKNVLKTPESVNTPVGISRLILDELTDKTEVFIVEMGAYGRGDIAKLCQIARPSIAILTGINQAHLERFGSLKNTIKAKFEIVENAVSDGLIVLNEDDERVMKNYQDFIKGRKVKFYSSRQGKKHLSLLGEYAKGIINASTVIARELKLSEDQIEAGIKNIKPIPHRLQPIYNSGGGILVIDDSYNGNPDGVREAIKVLASFKNKRKIYVTPGLVEMGKQSKEIHREIGRQLAPVAHLVVLIKNSATPFLAEGLIGAGFPEEKILWFADAPRAFAEVPKLLRTGDVVLFQNDWPDNYF